MAFKGITFAGQNVTPKNDGGLYQAHYGDGILWGCSMAISGDDLVIQSGEFIMGGRYVQVDGATNVDLSGRTLQTGYIQVIMNADLTQGEGNQWYTTFVESASTTFPALTQGDINDTDTLYQLELAVVQISGGNLTAITSSVGYSPLVTLANIIINRNLGGGDAGLRWYTDGVLSGRVLGSDNDIYMETVDSAGNPVGGYHLSSTYNTIFGNVPIRIRPNGYNSSLGEFLVAQNGDISVSGQQHGGHTLTDSTQAGTISLTANTDNNALGITLNKGIYVLMGRVQVSGLGTNVSNDHIYMTIAGLDHSRSEWRASVASQYWVSCVACGILNVTSDNTTYYMTVNPQQTVNCRNRTIRALQIA